MSHKEIKITVITATFNSKAKIRECVSSLNTQTHENLEWIVVDGVSTDGTVEFLKSQSKKIDKLIVEHDNGIYDALNKGIDAATGDFICFLHSDDRFYDKDSLSKIASELLNTGADAIYGNLRYLSNHANPRVVRRWNSRPFSDRLLRYGWMPPHPTLFVKKSVYDEIGCFADDLSISADFEFVLRLFRNKKYKKVFLNVNITDMFLGGESNRSISNIFTKTGQDWIALRRNDYSIAGTIFGIICKNLSKVSQFSFFRIDNA